MASKEAVSPAYNPPSLNGLSSEVSTNPQGPSVTIIEGKGDFLGGGATGLVERLDSGDVVKSPWTGRPTALDCKREMAIEAQIYKRLGVHPRLVPFKHWDPVSHVLTLEYMPHGNLREYIHVQKHGQEEISLSQKQQANVGPHNFLVDGHLSLRICDFGGSSLDGSQATVAPGVRYRLPNLSATTTTTTTTTTAKDDLFALGSTIYFIATGGHDLYEELADEDQVKKLYEDGVFPQLSDVPFAEIIALCWRQEAESAKSIYQLVMRL